MSFLGLVPAGPEAADRQVVAGNDLLDSGVSADIMDGGFGDHVYIVNGAGDIAASTQCWGWSATP
ncbi:hypothetical protein RSO01_60820 [Reyranella soli]|uniref:Peptidase M10 serralysin C-terminal domain-containing protein n=1 Tax=Reyranella soli TaxID=1230389 RepID=A0A512NIZ0_9HYPH|nr:hypothetical protein RSO01_60820 [Reyranella soli]